MTEPPPPAVTLREVAILAGVSQATASRAFNGSTRQVREDLRQRVLLAAKRLNYAPNVAAQAVARGQSNLVGLVVHDIADPYFSSIAAGVMAAAEEQRLIVTLGCTLRSPDREVEYLAALRGQRSRAVIIAGSRSNDPVALGELAKEIEVYERAGGHVVMISQARVSADTVVLQNRKGARDLAKALVGRGYRRFGILAGPSRLLTARDRQQGFKEGLSQAGVEPPRVVGGDFTRDGGHSAMAALLETGDDLDCVFAVNDVMAVGAMAACRDHGMTLPRDMAMAGFDDISSLRDIIPSLTTVRLPLEDIGRMAVSLTATHEPGGAARQLKVEGKVVLRDSTPPIKQV